MYTDDGSSKSILVDEKMTVAQVVDMLLAKNHFTPNLNWSIVESMPDLYMGKLDVSEINFIIRGRFKIFRI